MDSVSADLPSPSQATGARPRILFVSPVADFVGGAEVILASMLANRGVHPVLAAPEEGPLSDAALAAGADVCFYRPGAIMTVHRPPKLRDMLAAAADAVRCAVRLKRLAAQHDCQLIHSNGLKTHLLCVLLSVMSRLPTIVHMHDIPYRRVERIIWRLIAWRVTRMIIVSRPCFPGDVLPSNVIVVRNGTQMVSDSLPPPRADGSPLRLGFVGRFHPSKGLDTLVDWFSAIRRAGIDATLTIRGRADPANLAYWEAIQQRLRREGLEPVVTVDGWKTGTALYADLDILLLTSAQPDPAPLVVPEAMSAGIVVMAFPTGGIPDQIDDGHTGFLVSDPQNLLTCVRRLLGDSGEMQKIRRAAQEWVAKESSLASFYLRLDQIYLTTIRV